MAGKRRGTRNETGRKRRKKTKSSNRRKVLTTNEAWKKRKEDRMHAEGQRKKRQTNGRRAWLI